MATSSAQWERARLVLVVAIHAILVSAAYTMAFVLRFDLPLPAAEGRRLAETLPLVLVTRLGVFASFRLYITMWRFVGLTDMLALVKATALGSMAYALLFFALGLSATYPRSVLLLDWLLCVGLVGAARLVRRASKEWRSRVEMTNKRRALVVGAGEAGQQLVRAVRGPAMPYEIVGLVDDDSRKQHKSIHGVEVLGTIDELPLLCRALRVEEVLIAMPSSLSEDMRRIASRCRESRVTLKTVPSLGELLEGKAPIGHLHEVQTEDLLGRRPIRIDREGLAAEIRGRCVLVTGAGGSIGSELCRQVASFDPSSLVLLDRAETALYQIHLDLRQRFPELEVSPVIADVRDAERMIGTMGARRPSLIYHAAAYKHVPLMEEHPLEAIENNLFGTENVALAARRAGVAKLVFVSTDKAVRPVGVMGMTKRAAENLLLTLDGGPTTFVSVRFGNVLGSDGSVLPLFRWQLATGGPLTVTDMEATRYFMLLSEAAQLVLQAGALGAGGEIFILDMGDPVRIGDLAEDLIRLSGLTPGRDIGVDVIGLRPGERLREELLDDRERLRPSAHEKVFVAHKGRWDMHDYLERLEELRAAVADRDAREAVRLLQLACVQD